METNHKKQQDQQRQRGAARRFAPLILLLSLFGLLGLTDPAALAGGPTPDSRGISQVRNVEVEPGDMQLTVRWDEPERTGRGIRSYMVEARPLYGPETVEVLAADASTDAVDAAPYVIALNPSCSAASTERSCSIYGLQNDVDYLIEVWAVGRRGNGPSIQTTGTPMAPPPMRRIVVNAKGERGEEMFEVRIGDTVVGSSETTTEYERYVFEAPGDATGSVTVAFTNDYYDGYEIDRNLWVEWVGIGQLPPPDVYGTANAVSFASDRDKDRDKDREKGGLGAYGRLVKIYSDDGGVYSEGAWGADGCSPGFGKSFRITCGGIFTYGVIDEYGNLTDAGDPYLPEIPEDQDEWSELKLRARGTVGGERFAVRLDGSTDVLAQIVVTREWRTYRIPVPNFVNQKPVVAFMNDMDDSYHDFNLMVDWIKLGTDERVQAEAPEVWVNATGGCESGNILTDTMYCNGSWWFPAMSNT